MTPPATPHVGQIVLYRSHTGAYEMPAIVSAVYADVRELKGKVAIASLKSKRHVHLHVLNPASEAHEVIPHFNVPLDESGEQPRSWRPLPGEDR